MMHTFDHGAGNSQGNIPSLVARASISEHKYTRLILEKFANFVRTQVPHFGDFRNGVVPLGMRRTDNANGSSRGLGKRFFLAVLIVICIWIHPAWFIFIAIGKLRCKRMIGVVSE